MKRLQAAASNKIFKSLHGMCTGTQSILGMRSIPILALAALIAFGAAACKMEPEPPPSLGRVSIPQKVFLGDTVVADTSALRGSGNLSYQWEISDSAAGTFTNIQGAVHNSFTVNEGSGIAAGRYLRVTVTFNEGSRNSNTPVIAVRPFIDFSGYTGSSASLTTHQPPQATPGTFVLSNGITGNGLRISHQGDNNAAVTISEQGGVKAARSNNYLYFFVDHNVTKYAGTVTLELTFFDNASGNFNIQYVNNNSGYSTKSISRGGTNTFVTKSIDLDNCYFSSGLNQGAQFRIDSSVPIQRAALISKDDGRFAPFTDLNNMIGKGVTGYQAWFKAPSNDWHHWGTGTPGPGNANSTGSYQPGNVNVELWPAGWEDYLAHSANLVNTGFRMHDNSIAKLFNSHDRPVIRTHFKWMQEAGIDGAAVQRFFEETPTSSLSDSSNHLITIRNAAEEFGRIFYVMYDMSAAGRYNQDTVIQRIQNDWQLNIENKVINSPNYAQAEGKPVVCIWGVHANESTDNNRYIKVEATIQLVNWFRERGCYVIAGIPDAQFWRTDQGRHSRGREMYGSFDMISPWYIGGGIENIIDSRLPNGVDFCKANTRSWANNTPIAFMPTVWPGFAWTNMNGNTGQPNATPRDGGRHIWRQIQGYLNHESNRNNEIKSLYLAMFDEYDEGTNWMKGGVDYFDVPLNQYFKTHSADGLWLSSDYYMRMAKASIEAFKKRMTAGGSIGPLNEYNNAGSVIVEHSQGPVFWRNSFERRTGRLKYGSGGNPPYFPVGHLQIDVGVPNGSVIISQNVFISTTFTTNRPRIAWNAESDDYTPPSTTLGMVYDSNAKSGGSVFRLAGNRTSGDYGLYRYRIAETRIKVSSGMSLSFWQRAENLGENVTVDLKMDNNTYLSDLSGYNVQNTGVPINGWQQKTVYMPAAANGRYITEVLAAYIDKGTATGSFAALIDDIIISNN